MNGFLNIDKPGGITSFDVIRRLKKMLPPKHKIGHLGTLDPMATGVLPIAIGRATRIIEFITAETKAYRAEMVLGAVSETEDATGKIVPTGNCNFTRDELLEVINSFIGRITQIPPMYSAIHHQGKRLYELARQGQTVVRTPREIEIYSIAELSLNYAQELPRLSMVVYCSQGTYIRSLARDIGEKLQTGAYLSKLRRIQSGDFYIADSFQLERLIAQNIKLDEIMLPLDYPLSRMERVQVSYEEADSLLQGRAIPQPGDVGNNRVGIYSPDQLLIAIGEIKYEDNNCKLHPRKVLKNRA